jgi:HlyD family type I secretion membrane fusion protein
VIALDRDCPPSAAALIEGDSPAATNLLIATIAALVGALIGWLALAHVDEVVQAPGRVEPQGKVKIVNHPQGGRVAELYVHDGDVVAAGQALVAFDTALAASERAELLGRWQVKAVEAARLDAEQAGLPLAIDATLAKARPDLVAAALATLQARRDALAARRDAAARQAQARRGELDTATAELGRLRNRLALVRQERDAVRELAARGLYPNLKRIAVEREASDDAGELAKAEAAASAARAALAEAQSRLASVDKEWRSGVLDELGQATAERDRLAEELKARTGVVRDSVLRAPVGGVVQDLAVAGPGQSVAAQETLMKLVPSGDGLAVEARVANEDIGRVAAGMPATIKVRAFDYLRFGSVEGTVERVAADASPDPKTGALAYTVTVAADGSRLGTAPGQLDVVPGMTVDVEVKVGRRAILSYLTDRIFRFKEAFRET